MKWNSKIKKKPVLGDTKEKVWFALFPVKVEDKWIWLEKYIVAYVYSTYCYTRDVVVSEGIFTEKYYTTIDEAEGWISVERKFITNKLSTKSRCCGRCDGVNDICVSDMICEKHEEIGCEICYGPR